MSAGKTLLKRLLPRSAKPRTILFGPAAGLKMELDLQKDTQVWLGRYEKSIMRWVVRNTPSGAVCVDVGAADGLFSLLMARAAGFAGKLIAFDADCSRVRRSFQLNSKIPVASATLFDAFVGRSDQPGVLTLEEAVRDVGVDSLDMLKIDVDGAEVDVLLGSRDSIERFRPKIALEVHSAELRDDCRALLEGWGYSCELSVPPRHEFRPLDVNVHWLATPREAIAKT